MLNRTLRHVTLRTILLYLVLITGMLSLVVYVLFQARFLLEGPQITITSDVPGVQQSRVVTLEGTAQNIVRITLNGRQIFTNEAGYFSERIVLENGYTVATLRAHDRYGRTTTQTRDFVYAPDTSL